MIWSVILILLFIIIMSCILKKNINNKLNNDEFNKLYNNVKKMYLENEDGNNIIKNFFSITKNRNILFIYEKKDNKDNSIVVFEQKDIENEINKPLFDDNIKEKINLNKKNIIIKCIIDGQIKYYYEEYVNNVCNFCVSHDKKLNTCGNCKTVKYCSKECQRNDWKKHKLECKKILEEKESNEFNELFEYISNTDYILSRMRDKIVETKIIGKAIIYVNDNNTKIPDINVFSIKEIKELKNDFDEDIYEIICKDVKKNIKMNKYILLFTNVKKDKYLMKGLDKNVFFNNDRNVNKKIPRKMEERALMLEDTINNEYLVNNKNFINLLKNSRDKKGTIFISEMYGEIKYKFINFKESKLLIDNDRNYNIMKREYDSYPEENKPLILLFILINEDIKKHDRIYKYNLVDKDTLKIIGNQDNKRNITIMEMYELIKNYYGVNDKN